MSDAGLTHGGFYRHFRGKEELYAAAVRQSVQEDAGRLAESARAERSGQNLEPNGSSTPISRASPSAAGAGKERRRYGAGRRLPSRRARGGAEDRRLVSKIAHALFVASKPVLNYERQHKRSAGQGPSNARSPVLPRRSASLAIEVAVVAARTWGGALAK
jgi:AcrR family transcriptional regulator